MSDRIEPALTAEEWQHIAEVPSYAGIQRTADGLHIFGNVDGSGAWLSRAGHLAQLIALANAALPDDDPRKITRQTVADIRESAGDTISVDQDRCVSEDHCDCWERINRMESLADALESYLSPI